MPWEEIYREPRKLCRVEHVTIYYTYKNGNVNDVMTFWYTALKDDNDSEPQAFDIRELPNWGWNNNSDRTLHADCVREALWHGHLNEYLESVEIESIELGKSGRL